jgi:hypothetical protein
MRLAVKLCLGMSSLYVAVLYLLPASIRSLPRDAPRQIVCRSCAVAAVSFASVAAVAYLTQTSNIRSSACAPYWSNGAAEFLGLRWICFALAVGRPLLLVGLLYLGPLCTAALLAWVRTRCDLVWRGRGYEAVPRGEPQSYGAALRAVLADRNEGESKYTLARNLFVGPVFEEVCVCARVLPSNWSTGRFV